MSGTRADEEREDRLHCSMLDGPSEPGWVDEADTYTPEPFTAPTGDVETVAVGCGRLVRGFSHGSRWQVCGSKQRRDGRCAACGQTPREDA